MLTQQDNEMTLTQPVTPITVTYIQAPSTVLVL